MLMPYNKPVLATDLDGTLIPSSMALEDSLERQALRRLTRCNDAGEIEVVFVTGRHFESVIEVMRKEGLPSPKWVICDVGSSIFVRDQESYQPLEDYVQQIEQLTGGMDAQSLKPLLQDKCQLQLQEPEKQRRFKLSYYCDAKIMADLVGQIKTLINNARLPFGVISSVDPFNQGGLVDVMPRHVDKAYALDWWSKRKGLNAEEVVFAGDSGNDFAALTCGYRAILVGNATTELANSIRQHHHNNGTIDRLFVATQPTAAGVLQGCVHFGLIAPDFSLEST
jgi:sucrose-6F-phosphate phosphohydrolase